LQIRWGWVKQLRCAYLYLIGTEKEYQLFDKLGKMNVLIFYIIYSF
jgi:hypothetical protein